VSPLVGKIAYHAGANGTVNLAAGEKLLHVRAHATAAGSCSIAGGDAIPIPAGTTFEDSINSFTAEWVGAVALVFTGTDSYFVKTLQAF